MTTYQVEIVETLSRIVDVDAKSEREAIMRVKDMYNSEDIVLDSEDYVDTEFSIYDSY